MKFFEKFTLGIWNVGIIEDDIRKVIKNKDSINIRWMKHQYRDRFFADPFLYDSDEKYYYILAEEFPFYTDVGYISLLTVLKNNMKLVKKERMIEGPCHLSYPFLYEGFVVPEAYRSGECVGYTIKEGKITDSVTIMQHGLIDQTFLKHNGFEWIFATDKDNPLCGLKIFYRKIGDAEWLSHKKNPVSDDICSARPGGHFFEMDGKLYRPAQDSKKTYGHQIRIMQVVKLTPEEYEEIEIKIVSSAGNPPYNIGLHTFNVENGFTIVDGYKEYKSFVIKPLCVKFPKLMKWLGERNENKNC